MHTTKKNTRRALKLLAGATAIAVFASACGSDDDSNPSGEAQTGAADETTEQADESAVDSNEPADDQSDEPADDEDTNETNGDGHGLQMTDEIVRFSQLDWTLLGAEIRPDGPGDDGEDVDPAEDFVYVDLEVS